MVKARIIDSNLAGGYDIESINVGDTCKFLNVETDSPLSDNGVITSKTYNKDYVDIVVEDTQKYVSRMIVNQIQRQNLAEVNAEIPVSYTI